MGSGEDATTVLGRTSMRQGRNVVWLSGLWVVPGWVAAVLALRPPVGIVILSAVCAFALSLLPALLSAHRREGRLMMEAAARREEVEQLKLQLEAVRQRTARLRDELSAADQQARLSHQLTILGQFTAGFLHEFNNPLAILTNRIEILLDERKEDRALCADLDQMLTEARYMGKIAGTLLPALRRQRGEQTFNPCLPAEVLQEVIASLRLPAGKQGVSLVLTAAETPQVNMPAHVVGEIVRALVSNALQALGPNTEGTRTVWVRLEEYHSAGSRVVLCVEDDGPGVPENLRSHLFEPFVSRTTNSERPGLGLFLAASLLETYDGSVRYQPRQAGGASFVVEMPPARFTKGQPYHWFLKGVST